MPFMGVCTYQNDDGDNYNYDDDIIRRSTKPRGRKFRGAGKDAVRNLIRNGKYEVSRQIHRIGWVLA